MSIRLHARSGSPYETSIGFSRAVRVGDRIMVSGTAPVEPDGSCAPAVADQARRCFTVIAEALRDLGGDLPNIVRTRMYLVDAADAGVVGEVHAEVLGSTAPAATMVVVAALLDPAWRVEIEADAIIDGVAV